MSDLNLLDEISGLVRGFNENKVSSEQLRERISPEFIGAHKRLAGLIPTLAQLEKEGNPVYPKSELEPIVNEVADLTQVDLSVTYHLNKLGLLRPETVQAVLSVEQLQARASRSWWDLDVVDKIQDPHGVSYVSRGAVREIVSNNHRASALLDRCDERNKGREFPPEQAPVSSHGLQVEHRPNLRFAVPV
jgi:hypothetical protein